VLHGQTSTLRRAWWPLLGLITGRLTARQQQDLAMLDRDPAAHAGTKLASSLLACFSTLVLMIAVGLAGVSVATVVLVGAVLGAAVVGLVLPDRRLRTTATRRRTDSTAALSSYLDLVTVLLAGGAGLETALHAAADAGGGWTYEQLRAALVRARTTRQSVWTCFAELGKRTGIDELVELSASVQLAGQQGARIALSLATRATTLRARVLAGIEAEAHSASERMGLPTVLMFVGFLFLLGFPAAQVILASS
jgi:Flp pilus assembly protein TadB